MYIFIKNLKKSIFNLIIQRVFKKKRFKNIINIIPVNRWELGGPL